MVNVYFCYPSRVIGGAELLFYRCATFLKREDYIVHYIDYEDGFIAGLLTNNKIIQLTVYKEEPLMVGEGSIVVVPLSLMVLLDRFFKNPKDLKILCWSLSPSNLTSYIELNRKSKYSISQRKREEIGGYLKKLSNEGVIIYMDYNNYYSVSQAFCFSSDCFYVPVFIDDFAPPHNLPQLVSENDSVLTFLWLGRLGIDKRNTIATFINEIEDISKKIKVRLLIVGSGSEQEYLEKLSKRMHFDISFLGEMTGSSLENLIDEKVHIGLAMGLSAMEIAKRKKPVILEGFLNKEQPAGVLNDYICLCDSTKYDVVSPGYWDKSFRNSFEGLVMQIKNDYDSFADACCNYVYNNHTISKAGNKLENSIKKVQLNFCDESFRSIQEITKGIFCFRSKILRKISII